VLADLANHDEFGLANADVGPTAEGGHSTLRALQDISAGAEVSLLRCCVQEMAWGDELVCQLVPRPILPSVVCRVCEHHGSTIHSMSISICLSGCPQDARGKTAENASAGVHLLRQRSPAPQ
jgi:hypothetical protein